MNSKKALPIIVFALLAILAIGLRRCNDRGAVKTTSRDMPVSTEKGSSSGVIKLDRKATDLFFTKHARCRMKCRNITQEEVREILVKGTVNYNKSELNDPKGPTYAMEGITRDRQRVRIVFAPKQKHLSVVTVIDLENDYECNCD